MGGGFVAHPTKKIWTKPELRHFDTYQELVAFYGPRGFNAELEKLEKLAEQMQNAREQASPALQRRSASR
jgi:hypothetical protein